ncbi:MAG: GGDEF domain-containing protein [Candidatus Limiplasma sp.]|nr:GGDEF domain-containing protein [Candidatus Limiplasma sp.]
MCILAYVEMDAIGILILMFFWQNQRRFGGLSLDDRLFNGILFVTIVEQLMDAGQWSLEGVIFPGSYALQMLVYTVGHAIAPMITCLWAMYCDLRTNLDERGLKRRLIWYLLPMALHVGLLVANLFTPLVFRVDEAHVYHREPFIACYMILMFSYGILSMLLVIRRALLRTSSLERSEFRFMSVFLIPPFVGGALQWMFYGLSLIWPCSVLSIIMVYTNVLNRQISADPLTGLNNRRKLNRYLDLKINSSEADSGMYLIMMDADGFKGINDRYGHAMGDRALIAIADILKEFCQDSDHFLARLGGDEFVILGREHNGIGPQEVADGICQRVEQFNKTEAQPFQLSLSIGWARFDPKQINTTDALLTAADQSMYRVKAQRHAETF